MIALIRASLTIAVLLLCTGGKASRWVTVKATGYCPCSICCGIHADGKTATGRSATTRGIAVRKGGQFRIGMNMDVPQYGNWIPVDDHGGGVDGIDLRFRTHDEALRFGVQYLKVRVWE